MKQIKGRRALIMALLTILATECQSSEGFVEMSSVVPMLTSEITSSEKHSLYGFTDKELKAVQFAQMNWSNLTADMTRGEGEHLRTMAGLLAVKPAQKPAFYSMAKSKFSQLLPSSETTPEQFLYSLKVETGKLGKK